MMNEKNVILTATVAALMAITTASRASILDEDFESGVFPPAGWTAIDNTGEGGWMLNSDFGGMDNDTGGSGLCATISSDYYRFGLIDAELITPAFVIPDLGILEFDHSFRWYSGGPNEQADVDISIDGGTWTLLANYSGGDDGYPGGAHKIIDLDPYAGNDARIRFHYHDSNWDWWWQVDNVSVSIIPTPSTLALLALGVLYGRRRR